MQKSKKTGMSVIFSLYCIVSLYFVFVFSRTVSDSSFWARMCDNANVIPLRTIFGYFSEVFNSGVGFADVVVYTVGNIAFALPLGLFLPCLFRRMRPIAATLITTASVMFVLEFFQFVFKLGSFDVDSIILRTFGAAIGYVIYKHLMKDIFEIS